MTRFIAALLTFTVGALSVEIASGEGRDSPQKVEPRKVVDLPQAKETTLGLYMTAKEAYENWRADPEEIKILDVRFPEEYAFVGHAEMAWNIPWAVVSYQPQGDKPCSMKPNPTFVDDVKKWAHPGETILVMCRSGGRAAMAVNALADSGFKNVYNITDGMEGDTVDDPESVYFGKRMKNGWKNSGLPWTYDIDPKKIRLPKCSTR